MRGRLMLQAISRRVRLVLEQRGLTHEWLALESGIPLRTLSRRLHAVAPYGTTVDELTRIAAALDMEPRELIPLRASAVQRVG